MDSGHILAIVLALSTGIGLLVALRSRQKGGQEKVEELCQHLQGLKGLRVIHVNTRPRGGGVAEILHSLIPLCRSVGMDADWYAIPADESFPGITKSTPLEDALGTVALLNCAAPSDEVEKAINRLLDKHRNHMLK